MKKPVIIFFAFLAILLISLYTFYPSFNLAVFGDFWVTVWRYELLVGEFSLGKWNHFNYFFTLYGPQDIISGLLFKIFHYSSSSYYIFSYLLRLLAAVSFYPLTFFLTKNKVASFFAVLFFSITSIGLQTTDWVFNMPSYLTVGFFNLFLYFFLISRSNYRLKYIALFTLLFFITLVISPIRSMSIVPFIITIEFIWLIEHRTSIYFKKVAIRLTIVLLIYLTLITKTNVLSTPNWDNQTIMSGSQVLISGTLASFKTAYNLIQNGQFGFLLNPITIIGGMIIPILSQNKTVLTVIGLLFIIVWIQIIIAYKKSKLYDALIISLFWTIFSFLIPWLRPEYLTSVLPFDHRYLILSSAGICIFLSTLINLGKNKKTKYVIFITLTCLLMINIYSTKSYLQGLENVRNKQLYNKIWSQFPEIKSTDLNKGSLLFYFTGERADILFNVLEFGFPSKLQLLYHLSDYKTIITTGSFDEVTSAVDNGKSLVKFGLSGQPLPIENIYSVNLEGQDKLVDTTDITRIQILKALAR